MTAAPCFYLLKCGSGDNKYLQAGIFAGCNILTAIENTGSAFRKEERDGEKFQISFVDEAPGADPDNPLYVATNKDYPAGLRSVIVGKGESVTCVMESNYIRIVSPREGYLGFDEESESVVFVEDKSEEKKGSMWLQFEWQQLKFEVDEHGNFMRAADIIPVRPPVHREANIDKKPEKQTQDIVDKKPEK